MEFKNENRGIQSSNEDLALLFPAKVSLKLAKEPSSTISTIVNVKD